MIVRRIRQLLQHSTLTASHINQIQALLILHNLHLNTAVALQFINASKSLNLLGSNVLPLFLNNLSTPHIFICNTLLKFFSHSATPHLSLRIYSHMHAHSILPNHYTFTFVLKPLADLKFVRAGASVHSQLIKLGFLADIYVGNSLLNLYASSREMPSCEKVFDEMPLRDVVSWTVLVVGYREIGKFDDALIAFERMRSHGVAPNQVTLVNALGVCASIGALEIGIWIHELVKRSEWELDVILGTSLVDMYMKCGKIEQALCVFEEMSERNVFTWNAVIKGLALSNRGKEAMTWFLRMEEEEGLKPDEVTLIAVLGACVHSGFEHTGRRIFSSLVEGKYGFLPDVRHYACMVDLLSRSGCLEEAHRMIVEMPFEPTASVWGGLLAGCRIQGNLEMSELVAWKLVELEPRNSAHYVLLSNLYADMKRWSEVEKVRNLMKERELNKCSASSECS